VQAGMNLAPVLALGGQVLNEKTEFNFPELRESPTDK
jgi:hypothetical protein